MKERQGFAPGTVPEQSMKNMFSGPTNTKLELKAPKFCYFGTPREESYSPSYSVAPE